ncbi:MAG TPA: glutathionylspermidine synthase family protein [Alphaproteobacteria bacterium]|nr:glutathionylspermidine synthase family protein [Alphaproteobacteria bacterium]
MLRVPCAQRPDWRSQAASLGFRFHTIGGEAYWDEGAHYRFTLRQIEQDIERPTAEIEAMCLEVVGRACRDEELLRELKIPEDFWNFIADSWARREPPLYGRMDFAYDGCGPAKLYEYNADTPTSLYEAAFFQWIWLEQARAYGRVPRDADQYNNIQELLVQTFEFAGIAGVLHLTSTAGHVEDRGTVHYLEDCARLAGLETAYVPLQQIGMDALGRFTDADDYVIETLFKLYPWEDVFADEYAAQLPGAGVRWLEPPWKAILSNKGLLSLLWRYFEGHPNLLPAYFEGDPAAAKLRGCVRKPLFSREGANVEWLGLDGERFAVPGPYGAEGCVVQALHPLPRLAGNYAVLGSWVVGGRPAGLGVREDATPVTRDTSRFLPHAIVG